jgi:hypothetical protein
MTSTTTTVQRATLAPAEPTPGMSPARRFLVVVSVLLLASAAFHGVVFLLSGTPWEGPVSWRKPILFGVSFGLTTLSIAWFAAYLRVRPWAEGTLLGILGVATLFEVGLITMQTWRGVPSHFNFATPFDTIVFSAMGVFVTVILLAIAVLAVLAFTSFAASPALAFAFRAGMLLLVIGNLLGAAIIAVGVPAAVTGDEAAIFGPMGVVVGEHGILKSPHGIALHAIQVLPVLAWFAARFTDWSGKRASRAVAVATLGFSVVVAAATWLAFTGQPAFAVNAGTIAAVLGALLVALPYAGVGIAAIRERGAR